MKNLSVKELLVFSGIGLFGLIFTFYPAFAQEVIMLPGDIGDGRLNHFFLEQSWQFLTGNTVNSNYWDASFFYPVRNTMAFSDILLGVAPIYWIFRLFSVSPEYSFLIWTIIICVLNYVSMYLLLRKVFNFSSIASAGGAFLFSFAAARVFKFGHIQLVAQFYYVFFMYFVWKFYILFNENNNKSKYYLILATLCIVAQLYAGWYLGWFLVFGLTVYFILCLIFKESRNMIFFVLKTEYKIILLCLFLCVVLLMPMLAHYYASSLEFSDRPYLESIDSMTRWNTWLRNFSSLYETIKINDYTIPMSHEHLGLGLLTLVFSSIGLYFMAKKNVWLKCLSLTVICVYVLSVNLDGYSLWRFMWDYFPGASTVRAQSRIFFLVLFIFSIGFAFYINKLRTFFPFLLVTICIIEIAKPGYLLYPASRIANYSIPVSEIANKYDMPFFLVKQEIPENRYEVALDAMWASLISKKATVNGYTGKMPTPHGLANEIATCSNNDIYKYIRNIEEKTLVICAKDGGTYSTEVLYPLVDRLSEVAINQKLSFDEFYPYFVYKGDWAGPEDWGRWTNGSKAGLIIELSPNAKGIKFSAMLFPHPKKGLDIEVFVEGIQVMVENFTLPSLGLDIPLPKEVLEKLDEHNTISVDFYFPNIQSPKDLGLSEDSRKIGLGLKSLEVYGGPEDKLVAISKKSNINLTQYDKQFIFGKGWSFQEDWGRWSEGTKSSLVMKVAPDVNGIKLHTNMFMPGEKTFDLNILVNGIQVLSENYTQSVPEIDIPLPQEVINNLANDNIINIELQMPNANSPKKLGINEDIRMLGIGLQQIKIY